MTFHEVQLRTEHQHRGITTGLGALDKVVILLILKKAELSGLDRPFIIDITESRTLIKEIIEFFETEPCNIDKWNERGREFFEKKNRLFFIYLQIECYLPAFTRESSNWTLPYQEELFALKNLREFASGVRSLYEPGLRIFSDGHLYSDLSK